MRSAISIGLLAIGLIGVPVAAATEPAHNLESIHDELAAKKKEIVGKYMDLTEAEGKAFWPVYDRYQSDLHQLDDRTEALLASYGAEYRGASLTDEKAQKLLDDWIAIDQDQAKRRAAAAQEVLKVLPPKKAARYLQIEHEYRALVDYDLAATVPLAK